MLQTLPEGLPQQAELEFQVATGDIDELRARAQASAQIMLVPQQLGGQ
jgi:urea transporter